VWPDSFLLIFFITVQKIKSLMVYGCLWLTLTLEAYLSTDFQPLSTSMPCFCFFSLFGSVVILSPEVSSRRYTLTY